MNTYAKATACGLAFGALVGGFTALLHFWPEEESGALPLAAYALSVFVVIPVLGAIRGAVHARREPLAVPRR